MTQEQKGFNTNPSLTYAVMNTEESTSSIDKNDSEDSQLRISEKAEKVIVELNLMYGESKKKILELIQVLRTEDKLKDNDIKKVLFAKVNFVSKATLYRALPQEFKKEYSKPLPKTINISSEHKVIDVEPEQYTEPTTNIPQPQREPITPVDFKEEDPKDTEIDFLKEKVTELEDALRKTEQFKPATQLQQINLTDPNNLIEKAIMNDEHYFKWLADKADGTHSFYYDRYGFELFQTRILSQLKNSGVKVFKRLYFEV